MQPLLREPVTLRLDLIQLCVKSWQDCGAWAGSELQLCVGVTEMRLAAVTAAAAIGGKAFIRRWMEKIAAGQLSVSCRMTEEVQVDKLILHDYMKSIELKCDPGKRPRSNSSSDSENLDM